MSRLLRCRSAFSSLDSTTGPGLDERWDCSRPQSQEMRAMMSAARRQAQQELQLDLDVHTRGQVEAHEAVYGLAAGLQHIDKTLVGSDLELLP